MGFEIMENITKLEKNFNYKVFMKRLSDSLYLGYYIESITLEYAIMEDRLMSVLKHSNNFSESNHNTLHKKIIALKAMNKKENSISKEYISNDILDLINAWKIKRNKMVHNLMNNQFDFEEIKEMAIIGQEIVKVLNNKTTCLNRKFDKIYNLNAA